MAKIKRHYLRVYLSERDHEAFDQAFATTFHRSKSSYARALILKGPVKVIVRNRSLDDFIETAVKLRKELKILIAKDELSLEEKAQFCRQMTSIQENLLKIVNLCGQE